MPNRFQGKIGYTDDGFVWMQIGAQNDAGDPINMNITLNLQDAMDISKHLKEAAQKAANKRSPLILPEYLTVH